MLSTPTGSLRRRIALATCCVIVISILSAPRPVEARAVNISNTWILPEEGFPVFYRYFRDRISWYEADAVCQFHHANLVTVDTTAQYDAARAYLKELDIMSNVWIGLIKSNEEGDFTWTDYKTLSGEGYWASAPEGGRTPLCAALDPARDYRWGALSCGGPQVASFICELPVPAWALKPAGGCLVRSLPSLTVQFLPELAAVQLISDCGLDGTKKVTCKANESHSDILKELSCAISEEDFSDNSVTGVSSVEVSSGSPRPSPPGTWSWAPSTPSAGELSTRIRRETVPPSTPHSIHTTTAIPGSHITTPQPIQANEPATGTNANIQSQLVTNGPILRQSTMHSKIFDDSAVSENPKKATVTTIPSETSSINSVTFPKISSFNTEKDIENATPKVAQSIPKRKEKERHDIFTQATDHFIPPLVMAKSKLSADMTVVSPETKHQQYIIAHHLHQLLKTTEHTKTTNLPIVTNKIAINNPTESLTIPTSTSVVTENIVAAVKVIAEAVESNVPSTFKSNENASVSPATSKEQSVSYSKMTPPTLETRTSNQDITDKSKYRKPNKGKKYDKLKEEKKKYKDVTTESAPITQRVMEVKNPEESTHKVVEIKIPQESIQNVVEVKFPEESTQKVVELKIPEEFSQKVEVKNPEESTHKVVEVKIPDITGTNIPTILEITTKLSEYATKQQPITTRSVLSVTSTPAPLRIKSPTVNATHLVEEKGILIDPNLMKLNKEGSINNESETIHHTLLEVSEVIESNANSTQTQNVSAQKTQVSAPNKGLVLINHTNVSKVDEIKKEKDLDNSEETLEQNPEPLPRPNRSRTLTQTPQHRSFYPYFFNRVLG